MNDSLEPPHEPDDFPIPPERVYLMRRKHLPVLVAVATISVVCVGITGVYTGSQLVEKKHQTEVAQLKLQCDQRLAQQSSESAQEINRLGGVIGPLTIAVQDLDMQMRRRAKVTDRVLSEVQNAARAATEARKRTDQIAAQTEVAAKAAQSANQKLDTATHPTAVAPAKPWGWWNQRDNPPH